MIEIELKHPIKVEGEEISKLTLQRPTVKHLRVLDSEKGEVAKAAALTAALAGIPPSSVNQIDGEDFASIQGVIEGFLG